jgi:hypothetical protein
MRYYTEIPIWENKRRLRKLFEFRKLFTVYFNNSQITRLGREMIEEKEAQEARVEINRMIDDVHAIIVNSGVNPVLRWTAPATIGGFVRDIDLIMSIFQIHRHQITPNNALDFIDRAIGVYESDRRRALARTVNPFFYLRIMLDWLADLPFRFIGRLGFSKEKAESSIIGRALKGIIQLITLLASVLTILQLSGGLDLIKKYVK